jgi:hypothetical protein
MPFFENTEILRRDVQVLDHILTMEIKTHFILNLQRPTITTGNACATRPPKTVEIYGGSWTPPAHSMRIPKSGKYNGKQYIIVYTAISIKVVHKQSGKVEYERERLLRTQVYLLSIKKRKAYSFVIAAQTGFSL